MIRLRSLLTYGAVLVATTPALAADLSADLAVRAAQAAVHACQAQGYHITVTVLDLDLAQRVVIRGDGAPGVTVAIGYRKAYTVIKSGMSSGDFSKSVPAPVVTPAANGPGPPSAVNGDPNLITWAGGLPIKRGNTLVGSLSAAGAPGGDKDEACAKAGIDAIATELN
jgi:uncharacterized protein GlcG (DUF336 family)